jgi:hypothetical protein
MLSPSSSTAGVQPSHETWWLNATSCWAISTNTLINLSKLEPNRRWRYNVDWWLGLKLMMQQQPKTCNNISIDHAHVCLNKINVQKTNSNGTAIIWTKTLFSTCFTGPYEFGSKYFAMLWADLMMRYLYFVWRERLSALAFDRAMFGPSPSEANDYE